MSTLAVIAYPDQNTAGEAAAALGRMPKEFLMARGTNQERVVPEMAKFGGTVLKTNLTSEQQQALETAISQPTT